ncbi:DNA-binding transcriptional regulator, MarR family [Rathayibacter oskolensis]|uniref:DNA-binding transcriptional regulator, MarR family n=1 Tax=Rathayibacter oskolensis TaxID=1891671 RepID=A0A1X7N6J4_9MICO|nr:MarR family transcriptional regulator [Rathayibacter oskolensis]SMH32202.1 DNA-binding transcriptional regulator, MarR family [Rathayibacter oskolensis]
MPPQLSVSRDDIDSIAAWTVIRAARELARMLAGELEAMDLTPVEFGVLAQLEAADGLSQADLARAVGVRPQSMTSLTSGLEKRRLISRGSEGGRGRHSRIRLTAGGRTLLAAAYPVVLASNRWFGEDPHRTDEVVAMLRPLLGGPGARTDGVP